MSLLAAEAKTSAGLRTTRIDARPRTRRDWLSDQWAHREVLLMMARKQFHVRYKRASFGVLWAIAVPAVQAAALALVFSHFVHRRGGFSYPAYVLLAVLGWSYFSATLGTASISIVDGADLTAKLWFPRSMLVLAECLANLPGLFISVALFLVIQVPVLGVGFGLHTLAVIPAIVLLVAFTTSLSLVLSALHVYFRDVRYLVQAALLVFFYLTPIAYPQRSVGRLGPWMDFNPVTGLANLFHQAAVGHSALWATDLLRSVLVTAAFTAVMVVVALEVHRRHDRLFVDLL